MYIPAADNTFRIERIHGVPYWEPHFDIDALLARVLVPGFRGAIVGPHGHGKTTLLHELGERIAAQGHSTNYAHVGNEHETERALCVRGDTIYLVDGVERLSRLRWARFRWRMRRARGLVITAHFPGRLPTLHACVSTEATVAHLLHALDPPELEALLLRVPALFAAHGGDCRQILFTLYDEYAGRVQNAV